jgi:very-short-patch-repair endonuclease
MPAPPLLRGVPRPVRARLRLRAGGGPQAPAAPDARVPHSQLRRCQWARGFASSNNRRREARSEPERVLWAALRSSQLGVRFRRQVVICGYIVDFFAPAARLVVEVDGAHRRLKPGADKRRDRALAAAGLHVLRLPAVLVLRNLPVAQQLIAQELIS